MNAHNHDFTDSLEQAALRIARNLRLQSGLDTETRIVRDNGTDKMVFIADDADTPTLRRFLCEEMREAAKPNCRENVVPFELRDYPGSNRRGAVAMDLHPKLISTLVAKL